MILLPEDYARQEREAERDLPNRMIEACRPVLFDKTGYPTRTDDPNALWRWADAMHECRFERDFPELLGGLFAWEFQQWAKLSEAAHRITARMGHPVVPRSSLTRAFYIFRHIRAEIGAGGLIVEVGPGSGYLSALLGLAGYTVHAVEVSQAFYLWQSHLYTELGLHGIVFPVPWWEFYAKDRSAFRVKLVTANQCLCEMSAATRHFLSMQCAAWKVPLLMEGIGSQMLCDENEMVKPIDKHKVNAMIAGGGPAANPDVSFEDIVAYQTALGGREDLRTADERWLQMVYGGEYYS